MIKQRASPQWTEEQDQMLREVVAKHGVGNWSSIKIPSKNGKQCRERWISESRFMAGAGSTTTSKTKSGRALR